MVFLGTKNKRYVGKTKIFFRLLRAEKRLIKQPKTLLFPLAYKILKKNKKNLTFLAFLYIIK